MIHCRISTPTSRHVTSPANSFVFIFLYVLRLLLKFLNVLYIYFFYLPACLAPGFFGDSVAKGLVCLGRPPSRCLKHGSASCLLVCSKLLPSARHAVIWQLALLTHSVRRLRTAVSRKCIRYALVKLRPFPLSSQCRVCKLMTDCNDVETM